MDTVRLTVLWDSCPLIARCTLPYSFCFTCHKTGVNKKPDHDSKREVKDYGYDEYRPSDT